MQVIDLHTHSRCSDGQLSPAELVERAHAGGVQCLALTDHDCIDGLAEARETATGTGLELVNGVEISVSWRNRSIHVVGLGFSSRDAGLLRILERLQQARMERAEKMAAKLEKAGVRDCLERIQRNLDGGQITRTHFAHLLVEDGICSDLPQAFKRYLKPGKPGYVKSEWIGMQTCVDSIHAAGGVAVLAHPLSYSMTAAWQDRLLGAFHEAGGRAMEVVCGAYNPAQVQRCAELARKYGFEGSVGSDFHAPTQRWLRLGRPLRLPPDIPPVWQRWTNASPASAH